VDDRRLGAAIRTIRLRRGWRQDDLALRAGLSRWSVLRIEHGRLGSMRLDALRRVADALDAHVYLQLRWQGGDLDRLVNARHSAFHEVMARRFASLEGWTAAPEVSFSIYGERGVIDILAFHPATGSVLVVELKTEIVDVQELLGTLDRKRRLAQRIASERGWVAHRVGVWLAVAESTTNRRRVAVHGTVLRSVLPSGSRAVTAWLREPGRGGLAALSFVSEVHGTRTRSALAAPRRASTRSPCVPGSRSRAGSALGATGGGD
jgi:transcriptional regulator with XRE-family HTH domain